MQSIIKDVGTADSINHAAHVSNDQLPQLVTMYLTSNPVHRHTSIIVCGSDIGTHSVTTVIVIAARI
jgi:hypothetical protein